MVGTNTPLIRDKLSTFLEMPGESLVLYTWQHPLFLLPPLSSLVFFVSLVFALSLFLINTLHLWYIFAPLSLSLLAFTLSAATKIVIDWYFHIYVVTTHKLVEISYSPFFMHKTNTILLDQVRCTEIDEGQQGILEELCNFGDITLTFDRPTHSEEFTLHHISNPIQVATELRNVLIAPENLQVMNIQQTRPTFFGRRMSYA